MNNLTCVQKVWHTTRALPCGAKAKVTFTGLPYCLRHDPERVNARREAKRVADNQAWQDRLHREALREAQRNARNELIDLVIHIDTPSGNSAGVMGVTWERIVRLARAARGEI